MRDLKIKQLYRRAMLIGVQPKLTRPFYLFQKGMVSTIYMSKRATQQKITYEVVVLAANRLRVALVAVVVDESGGDGSACSYLC
jgi:hypothetical protein